MKIAIAGTGYVGLSNGILLAQHNEVVCLDIVPEKVAQLNQKQTPIEDTEIEHFLQHKTLNFRATLNKQDAYQGAGQTFANTSSTLAKPGSAWPTASSKPGWTTAIRSSTCTR
jgi:UDP-glucose 6-dehydrogenase